MAERVRMAEMPLDGVETLIGTGQGTIEVLIAAVLMHLTRTDTGKATATGTSAKGKKKRTRYYLILWEMLLGCSVIRGTSHSFSSDLQAGLLRTVSLHVK